MKAKKRVRTHKAAKKIVNAAGAQGKTSEVVRPRRRVRFLLPVVVAILVGIIAFTQIQTANASAQLNADTNAVKEVVTEAFVLPQTLVVVPEQTSGPSSMAVSTSAAIAPSLSTSVKFQASASAISFATTRLKNRFDYLYAPGSLIGKYLYGKLLTAINGQSKGNYRALGGGIRNIHWRHVLISGDQATVTVDAVVWSHFKYTDQLGKVHVQTPTQGFVKIFTLQKINGQWLIQTQVDDDLQSAQMPINLAITPVPTTTPTASASVKKP